MTELSLAIILSSDLISSKHVYVNFIKTNKSDRVAHL